MESRVWGVPFGEYPSLCHPMVGPQTHNRVEVSAVRALLQTVGGNINVRLFSDSKWCVDILLNIEM